jgi:hypothetical protein
MNRIIFAFSAVSCLALAFAAGCGSSSSGGSSASGGCFKATGSGSSEVCIEYNSTVPDFSCSDDGAASGSCPTAGLFGCCTVSSTSGSYSTSVASCYYDSTSGASFKSACTGAAGTWSTSP